MSEPKVIIFKAGITEGEIALKICKHFGLRRKTRVCQYSLGDSTIYASFDTNNRPIFQPEVTKIITEVIGPDWVCVRIDFNRGDLQGFTDFLVDKLGGLDSAVIHAHIPKDFHFYNDYPDAHNPYANPEVLDSIIQAIKVQVAELDEARRQNAPKKHRKRLLPGE